MVEPFRPRHAIALADLCCTETKVACCDWQLMKPKNPVESSPRPTRRHLAAGMRSAAPGRTVVLPATLLGLTEN